MSGEFDLWDETHNSVEHCEKCDMQRVHRYGECVACNTHIEERDGTTYVVDDIAGEMHEIGGGS